MRLLSQATLLALTLLGVTEELQAEEFLDRHASDTGNSPQTTPLDDYDMTEGVLADQAGQLAAVDPAGLDVAGSVLSYTDTDGYDDPAGPGCLIVYKTRGQVCDDQMMFNITGEYCDSDGKLVEKVPTVQARPFGAFSTTCDAACCPSSKEKEYDCNDWCKNEYGQNHRGRCQTQADWCRAAAGPIPSSPDSASCECEREPAEPEEAGRSIDHDVLTLERSLYFAVSMFESIGN